MSHNKDTKSITVVNSKNVISFQEWRQALNEAKAQLPDAKVRVAKLKAAIRLFTEKLREAKNGTAKESVPA